MATFLVSLMQLIGVLTAFRITPYFGKRTLAVFGLSSLGVLLFMIAAMIYIE
jgi:hypothetical protein